MQVIVEEFKKPNSRVSYDAILADLRDTIRTELRLEPITGPIWWLRLSHPSDKKASLELPTPTMDLPRRKETPAESPK